MSLGAFAQHCLPANSTTSIPVPPPGSSAGLTPSYQDLTPGVVGQYLADTIIFTNFSSAGGIMVNSLTIDSINNLPTGLCWETSSSTNTFGGGQAGVILVSGTPTSLAGQYKLVIWVSLSTSIGPLGPANAEALTGQVTPGDTLRYYVRLDCPGAAVQPVDTVRERALDSLFFPYYPGQPVCLTGIRPVVSNLSNLSVMPNPMSSSSSILTFSSDISGTFTYSMMNLLGEVVSTKEVSVRNGDNNLTIDRNGLSSGVYILSLNNGNTAVTKKIVIE